MQGMNLVQLKGKTAIITVPAAVLPFAGADIGNFSTLEEATTVICPVTREIPQKESRN